MAGNMVNRVVLRDIQTQANEGSVLGWLKRISFKPLKLNANRVIVTVIPTAIA